MLRKTSCTRSIFSLLLAMISQAVWSAEETNTSTRFPRVGRATLSAAGAGVGTAAGAGVGIFGGDVMQPVYGNDNGFLFADFMGDGATSNTFLVSPGVGYRQVVKNQIWGAYFFGDNEKVNLGKNFWNLSPGIEWMTPHWDVHANGYFPLPQTKKMGETVFADTLGNYDYVSFVNGTHNQYDALTAPYDVIGNGGDVELAYRFAVYNNFASRVYVGGYFYEPASATDFTNITNVKNITGVTVGLEQSLTKNIRASLMNSYDSLNSYTIGVRLQLTFGDDSTTYSNNVHDRLLEPIERHVGIIATGAGTYDQLGYRNLGNALEYNNVYFLAPNGVAGLHLTGADDGAYLAAAADGTYGNPMNLSQASLDAINSQSPNSSRLYLQGGNGAVYDVNVSNTGTYTDPVQNVTAHGLLLYNGQDLYGRSANYTAPAASNERPIVSIDGNDNFNGVNGFIIQNGGENTFSDLAITASTTNANFFTTYGIGVITSLGATADATVNVINTSVTALNTGLYAGNSSTTRTLTINAINSSFNGNTNTQTNNNNNLGGANGLYANNSSTGNLTINATSTSFSDNTMSGPNNWAAGLYATNNTGNLTINATDSSFNNNTSSIDGNAGAFGLKIFQNTGAGTQNITVINSQFNDNTATATNNAGGYGISVTCSTCSASNLNITNSSFNGNTASDPNGGAYGLYGNFINMNVNITNSTFNDNINNGTPTTSTGAFGVEFIVGNDTESKTINITNSQFNGNRAINVGNGNPASGLLVQYNLNTGSAALTVNVAGSEFNNNVISGDANSGAIGFYAINAGNAPMAVTVTGSQFNGNSASGNNNGGAYGLVAQNASSGSLTFSATESQFNGNTVSGSGASALGYGFYVDNSTIGNGPLSVTSLAGSTFSNNGNYGLFAAGNSTPNTTVNLAGTTFLGNPASYDSSGNVSFTE